MKKIADNALKRQNFNGYDGEFDIWLQPFCKPTMTAEIRDEDYPEQTGRYYIISVTTKLSNSGGVRTIQPGIRVA